MGWVMMKGGHRQTNQLYDINWGAFNHASRAPYTIMLCVTAINPYGILLLNPEAQSIQISINICMYVTADRADIRPTK